MPLLEYRCSDCGKKTEDLVLAGDAARRPACASCGSKKPSNDFCRRSPPKRPCLLTGGFDAVDGLRRRPLRQPGVLRGAPRKRKKKKKKKKKKKRGGGGGLLGWNLSTRRARSRFRPRPAFAPPADGGKGECRSSLLNAAAGAFGADAVYANCHGDRFSFDEVLAFLASKGKLERRGDGASLGTAPACSGH